MAAAAPLWHKGGIDNSFDSGEGMVIGRALRRAVCLAGLVLLLAAGAAQAQDFASWMAQLRRDALADGVSQATVNAALSDVRPIDRVIELDRQQPEFTMTFQQYAERVVPPARVERGRALLAQNRALLTAIGQRFGVQPRFIVALWAIESDFGRVMGDYPIIDALATLAYDGRRSKFFRGELMHALHILDEQRLPVERLTGSWAGAMGQCQFMPSSYRRYAVDYTGDGKADIWDNQSDVFASIANYLGSLGWNAKQNWGMEVDLPANFNSRLGDGKTLKTVSEWARLGVRTALGKALPASSTKAAIVLPAGISGPAYLALPNYRVIMRWNPSDFFAIATGLLADRIGEN
ncbi:MAG: lytic murein transglycosylase [Dongiaceae bacterium]